MVNVLSPSQARELIRRKEWRKPTCGVAKGYVQANLVILPKTLAYDFLLFCQRNPKPCPLLEVTEEGSYEPKFTAPGADLRRDLPKYRIYIRGELKEEVLHIVDYWRKDLVSFLLGCSFTFESALFNAGIPLRHLEEGKNVPMYITNIACQPAGLFAGPMVVSMRPIFKDKIVKVIQITSRYPLVHGAPIHIGEPETIGIKDLNQPDYGDAVTIRDGEVPLFWACGVTPQAVALQQKPELMITHSPGHMFITDLRDEDLAVF